jgi:hypothetical protein
MRKRELREMMGLTKEMLSRRYDIPLEVIDSWESGSALPPADIMEMLQNAADHYIPRSKEETMSLPMTVFELKWCCEYWIRKGYTMPHNGRQMRRAGLASLSNRYGRTLIGTTFCRKDRCASTRRGGMWQAWNL